MGSPQPPDSTQCTVPLVEVCVTDFDLARLPETTVVFDRLMVLRPGQVVLDLSGCGHIDAAAIGLLLDVHRRLVRAGGSLTIRDPGPHVQDILRSTGLHRVLPMVTRPAPVVAGCGTAGALPASSERPGGTRP
ncbi:STAS domain-containing protein [Plantactinospora sp. GCM10030261]|uniref:STAS domain-containing protein n=1 Tax=Plantactinospora sp. GCM10030261 TaxID=3273420 RepID=UPI00360A20CF